MNSTTIKDDGCWQDITNEFKMSIKHLKLGELFKMEQFTLSEAMSAIELMDPRMDGGMVLKKSGRKILNLEQSVRQGLVKVNQLELDELIGIIDETYACLATWLEGHSLAQTVMTNLYLHDTERIENRCLRIFSQSILLLIDFIEVLVQTVYCIEEEDFQLNCGKFDLNTKINDQRVLNALEDLCQYYEKLLADQNSSNNNNNNSNNNNVNNSSKQPQHEHNQQSSQETTINQMKLYKSQLTAIIDRLRFTYNFYACFLIMSRILLKDQLDLGVNSEAQIQKTVKMVQNSVINCDQHLEKCLKYSDNWRNTTDLGIKPEKVLNGDSHDGDFQTIMGFEPLIAHKLLPSAYFRLPSIKSRPSTVEYLNELVIKLRECISLSTIFSQKSFNKSLESIEQFSKYFKPRSCVVSRSFIQVLYLPNRRIKLLKDELLQSLSDYCEPLVQLAKKDDAISNALNEFLNECCKTFSSAITIYGHNTARQHERIPELILSFKNLQYSAFLISDVFKNSVLYSWTTCHLAKLCIKYVLAGLELELFSPHEYPYVFWYLCDILYKNEKEQLELARQYILDSQLTMMNDNQKKSKNKKQRRKNQFNTSFHDKSIVLNDAYRCLTGGMFLLTYGLKVQEKIKSPSTDYTNEEICFDHRFGSLTGGSVYQSYKLTRGRLDNLEFIYREALECFSDARLLFEKLEQYEKCLKVCKANMVVARILSSNLDYFADREVEFCFDTHPSFPTVKF